MGAPRRFAIPNDCLSCTLSAVLRLLQFASALMTESTRWGA